MKTFSTIAQFFVVFSVLVFPGCRLQNQDYHLKQGKGVVRPIIFVSRDFIDVYRQKNIRAMFEIELNEVKDYYLRKH